MVPLSRKPCVEKVPVLGQAEVNDAIVILESARKEGEDEAMLAERCRRLTAKKTREAAALR